MDITRIFLTEYLHLNPQLPRLEAINRLYHQSQPGRFHIEPGTLFHEELQHLGIYAALNRWHPIDLHTLFETIKDQAKAEADYYFLLKTGLIMQRGETDRLKLLHQYFMRRPRCPLERIFVLLHAIDEEEKKVLAVLAQAIFKSTFSVSDYLFLQEVWRTGILPRFNTVVSTYRQIFRLLLENGLFETVEQASGQDIWTFYTDLFGEQELLRLVKNVELR